MSSMGADGSVPLTPREAASGLLGSVSMTCWIFLLVPQLIENYRNGNAEAISLLFIFVWFIGDIANLAGGLMADLVPVILAIAVYFCIADGVLIGQCLYYKAFNARSEVHRRRRSSTETPDPTTPLLGRRFSDAVPPQGRRRSSGSQRGYHAGRRDSQPEDSLAKIVEESEFGRKAWIKNFISVLGIFVVGMAGWTMAWKTGMWAPAPETHNDGAVATGGQVLGYFSAVCYLGARLPQIYKNYSDKSCEGLSLLFFILSLMGNLTYGAGILFHSTEREYVLTNLPWLIGSLGTMVEDVVIFIQFRIYAVKEDAPLFAAS
ncbi:hypothetical protein N7448_009436 [Penicillium atrosanguineum]|uniref:Vacuolar membrane PQ loop repeat protein n=1 Tax=Penicillium atrosanguineum TaxID=1132637 RepID=A0A9W9PZT7_9EURO|nr:uncharacterized protein N7443_006686 [Penicillium atrosanguineum]KAJ5123339.1 hypothetical protein N7448_009436 [Penicillium atrosanguineum]KAJ5141970.1 hypothetical protein N7526_002965 [Penicillium atrosanguineum]KAJ5298566.1 hypothetical protein N7443_006686 [Penicillium atrosanguineum]KAJ5321169.1 hypothetical protein N7476_004171 [Penicillium atrosanguineum]